MTKSEMAALIEPDVRLRPPVRRCHQLFVPAETSWVLSFILPAVIAVSS